MCLHNGQGRANSRRCRSQAKPPTHALSLLLPLPLPQVTIVGKVLSTQESGLTYGLTIDDGTGRAATKIWISEDGE